jgi:DNA-binding protein HU-beta
MNKAELINQIAKDTKVSKVTAAQMVDSLVDNVSKSLKKGDKVTLVGFGTFATSKRKARTGRNPQTGATIKIAARRVVRFKAGKELATKVR